MFFVIANSKNATYGNEFIFALPTVVRRSNEDLHNTVKLQIVNPESFEINVNFLEYCLYCKYNNQI